MHLLTNIWLSALLAWSANIGTSGQITPKRGGQLGRFFKLVSIIILKIGFSMFNQSTVSVISEDLQCDFRGLENSDN
jgi:hypothetical protein